MCNQIGQILVYIYSTKILAIGIMQLRNAFYSCSGGSTFVSDNDHIIFRSRSPTIPMANYGIVNKKIR